MSGQAFSLKTLSLLHLHAFLVTLRAQIVQELLIDVVLAELLNFLVDFALESGTLIIDRPQLHRLVVSQLLGSLKFCSGLTSLIFDLGEEFEERLRVLLEHLLGADQTELSHLVEVSESLDLLVFLLKEHLNEEHLTLFLNEVPTVLSVLWALNRHIETGSFCLVDLVLDVRVDRQLCRWDVSLT